MKEIDEARKSVKKTYKGMNSKEKTKEKINYSANFDDLIDLVEYEGKVCFLTADLKVKQEIVIDGKIFLPPLKENLPYLIPSANNVLSEIAKHKEGLCQEDELIYNDFLNYHQNISELPESDYYHLLALWDFHTYLIEKLHFSPILYLFAVKERGKSRTAKGCVYVARRGVFTETLREADLIRWANDHKAAIAFDITNFHKKVERNGCDDLILARFEKGAVASRTLWPDRGPFQDTKTYQTFGPTIIATNQQVSDILESRSISIEMKPTSKRFNDPVIPEVALPLKVRLTAFRAAHFNKSLVEINKPLAGRLGDITKPLYQIVMTFFPKQEANFLNLLEKIKGQKKEEAMDSLEAQLVLIVKSLEDEVEEGFLATNRITEEFNSGKNERFWFKPDTVGSMLRGIGFPSKRKSSQRGILYDPRFVDKLLVNYGLKDLPNDTHDTYDAKTDTPNNSQGDQKDKDNDNDISKTASQASRESPDQAKEKFLDEAEAFIKDENQEKTNND